MSLSPRDIQTRIRSGATLEDVAREAEMPMEKVEPFAAPVLAEREHVAGTALQCPVRRRGETGSVRSMRAVVSERLMTRALEVDDVEWDAWRNEDRRWTVVGRYGEGEDAQEARFVFDPRARFSTAQNDQARWLIGEYTAPSQPTEPASQTDPMSSPDAEPTIDLNDELALVRAVQGDATPSQQPAAPAPATQPEEQATEPAATAQTTASAAPQAPGTEQPAAPAPAQPAAQQEASSEQAEQPQGAGLLDPDDEDPEDYSEAELEQVNGIYDFVPKNTADMDVLYEMLSSFAEDSVNIYEGLTNPVAPAQPAGGQDVEEELDDTQQPTGPVVPMPAPTPVSWRPVEAVASPAAEQESGAPQESAAQQDVVPQAPGEAAVAPRRVVLERVVVEEVEVVQGEAPAPQPHETHTIKVDQALVDQVRQAQVRQSERPESTGQPGSTDQSESSPQAASAPETESTPSQPAEELLAQDQATDVTAERALDVPSTGGSEAAVPQPVAAASAEEQESAEELGQDDPAEPQVAAIEDVEPTPTKPSRGVDEVEAEVAEVAEATVQSVEVGVDRGAPAADDDSIAARGARLEAQIPTPAAFAEPKAEPEVDATGEPQGEQPSTSDESGAPAVTGTLEPEVNRPKDGNHPADDDAAAPAEEPAPQEEPPRAAPAPKPRPAPRSRKKRASIPSWDEIMFGGPTPKKD